MTVLMSGVNMFAMAKVMQIVLGWHINFSIWVSSLTVAIYVTLGGLRSAIFNEVDSGDAVHNGIVGRGVRVLPCSRCLR